MSESTRCWNCGGRLVGRNGQPKPPLIFAEVEPYPGQRVRVHKMCVGEAGLKLATAAPRNMEIDRHEDDIDNWW